VNYCVSKTNNKTENTKQKKYIANLVLIVAIHFQVTFGQTVDQETFSNEYFFGRQQSWIRRKEEL
jgi:hypothetical protein